jgi:hypothetical protein
MKITDEAKILIAEALVSNDCDCLEVTLQQSCCGTSLDFALAKLEVGEKPILVNGISVMMDDQTQAKTETVTLLTEDGELVIQDETQSCCCN